MRVIEHLEKSSSTLFSFEILPPRKGRGIDGLFNSIESLMPFNPSFINVTYHSHEFVYKKRDGGLLEKVVTRKRPGTVGICAAIKQRFDIDTVAHMICSGFTVEETEDALIDLAFLGIDNLLVLRGDPPSGQQSFAPEPGGHANAIDLLNQVKRMNEGIYLHEDLEDPDTTSFCVGVAGYPEKHVEAPNMENDIHWLKAKVDAGAEYIVTQMFFNNKAFFEFEALCRENDITVPIIPGLKPLTTPRHLQILPKSFFLDLPADLCQAVQDAETPEGVRQVGIEWAIQQGRELIEHGVPCLHFFTMGRSTVVQQIAKALF